VQWRQWRHCTSYIITKRL